MGDQKDTNGKVDTVTDVSLTRTEVDIVPNERLSSVTNSGWAHAKERSLQSGKTNSSFSGKQKKKLQKSFVYVRYPNNKIIAI